MASQMIQESFSGGELSKRLWGRYSTEMYKKSLAFSENFEHMPQGSIFMRAGSYHTGLDFGEIDAIRLVQMHMADEQDFVIALLDHKLRMYSIDGGAEEIVIQRDVIENGDFALTYLDSDGHRQASDWTKRNIPPSGYTAYPSASIVYMGSVKLIADTLDYSQQLRQKVTNSSGAPKVAKVFVKIKEITGGYVPSGAHTGEISNTVRVLVETGDGAGLIVNTDYDHKTLGDVDTVFEVDFTAPAGDFYVNVYIAPQHPLEDGWAWSSTTATITQVACALVDASGVEVTTPWSAAQVGAVQWEIEPSANRIIFVHPNAAPWYLWYDDLGFWGWQEVPFISKPSEWHDQNWPSTIVINDGRLVLGGTPKQRNRLWASRSNNLFDLTLDTDTGGSTRVVLASDAIDVKVATKGVIRWLSARRVLLIGTDLDEHTMVGSGGAPVKPTDLQVTDQSDFGSAPIQAIPCGGRALYVSPDRRKVRAAEYNFQTAGWDTKDLTFVAEHLTKPGIKELHRVKHPESLLFGLLNDGTFAVCTFDPAEQVTAWWRLRLAMSPAVLSAAASSGPDGTFLWLAVRRNGTVRLERIQLSEVDNPISLDAYVEKTVGVDGSITGLGHLEGMAVKVVVNGNAMLETSFTVAAGAVTVDAQYAGAPAVVGLQFIPKCTTLPKLRGSGQVRSPKIGVLLNDSALPMINGKRPPDRTPATPLDSGEPRRGGKWELGNLGWDNKGQIEITQDLPFRTEILGLYDTTQVNDT